MYPKFWNIILIVRFQFKKKKTIGSYLPGCTALGWCNISGGSGQAPLFRKIRFTELTDGNEWGSHTLCATSCSLISQANMPGFSCLNFKIFFTTVGVATCYNRKPTWKSIPIFWYELNSSCAAFRKKMLLYLSKIQNMRILRLQEDASWLSNVVIFSQV